MLQAYIGIGKEKIIFSPNNYLDDAFILKDFLDSEKKYSYKSPLTEILIFLDLFQVPHLR